MARYKTKRRYIKSRLNRKSRRKTKKQYGRKIRQTKKETQKGGFKIDEVDILEDRDDDWMVTKQ